MKHLIKQLIIALLCFTIFSCNSDNYDTNSQAQGAPPPAIFTTLASPDNITPLDNEPGNPFPEAPKPPTTEGSSDITSPTSERSYKTVDCNSAPTGFTFVSATNTSATLNFTNTADDTRTFEVRSYLQGNIRSNVNTNVVSYASATAGTTTITIGGLTSGTAYNFGIRALCSGKTPSPVATASGSTTGGTAPTTPVNPTNTADCNSAPTGFAFVSATNTSVTFKYNNTANDTRKFEIRSYLQGNITGNVNTNVISYASATAGNTIVTIGGLTSGTSYDFGFRALCSGKAPSPVARTSGSTTGGTAPTTPVNPPSTADCNSAPTGFAFASATNTSVTFNFNNTANDTRTFEVRSYLQGNIRSNVNTNVVSYASTIAGTKSITIGGLTAGTTYDFGFRALCSGKAPSPAAKASGSTTGGTVPTPPETILPSTGGNTSLTDETDRTFFKQLSGFANIYNKKEIISDFKFGQYPMYFIQTEGGGFSGTGTAIKGFVINPISQIEGAQKLGENESFGLNIYRLDRFMKDAENILKSGNGFYDFNYPVDGKGKYYLQKYNTTEVIGLNGTTGVTVAVHEAFHMSHQNTGPLNPNWKNSFNAIQDTNNFPFTKEIVELQILISEVLRSLPNINDTKIIREKMKQYIAIRSKTLEIDPSPRKLIKNMSLEQERIEGGAHYIEKMAEREFFNSSKNISFWSNQYGIPLDVEKRVDELLEFESEIKTKAEKETIAKGNLKEMLSFGFFYQSGASVMFGINILDKSKMAEYNSKTPYDIISGMIPMSASEKNEALKASKASVNWALIQEMAIKFTK